MKYLKQFEARDTNEFILSNLKDWDMEYIYDKGKRLYIKTKPHLFDKHSIDTLNKVMNKLNIRHLSISNLGLESLELLKFPSSLESLDVSHNKLKNITNFPPMLNMLNCNYNIIENLDNLPETIEELYCSYNKLKSLPKRPLRHLSCSNNNELPYQDLTGYVMYQESDESDASYDYTNIKNIEEYINKIKKEISENKKIKRMDQYCLSEMSENIRKLKWNIERKKFD